MTGHSLWQVDGSYESNVITANSALPLEFHRDQIWIRPEHPGGCEKADTKGYHDSLS